MSLPRRCARAFTLVELLAVIAIALILLGMVLPAIKGMTRSRGLAANTANMSGLIDQARQAAMGQNTFVWLGIANTQRDGVPALAVALLVGSSGQSSDLSKNNYRLLAASQVLKNLALDGSTYLSLKGVDTANNTDFAAYAQNPALSFTLKLPGDSTATTFSAIEFKPDGEVTLGTPAKRYLGIGLVELPASANGPQGTGIQISLLSGQNTVFHP